MFSVGNLTNKQAAVLEFIREVRRGGEPAPTYREIASHFGFKSTKAAADHVYALEKKGYIRRHSGRSRGIELLPPDMASVNASVSVPIMGNIPAGLPTERTEQYQGTLSIDPAILGKSAGHHLFALKVNGDSMEGRGIYEGDWVIADADTKPHEGDMVAALIDGQNTLKTIAKRKGQFFLKAENVKYPDLIPIEEMVIQGVVRAVIRRVN